MLDYGFYNMDCMEGMKQFPDKFFDLAIVDPPYGAGFTENGGCQGWFSKYHQTPENIGGVEPIRRKVRQIQEGFRGGGWHGKQKYHLGTLPTEELPKTRRNMGLCELEDNGRRSKQKNHFVGRCPETGIF